MKPFSKTTHKTGVLGRKEKCWGSDTGYILIVELTATFPHVWKAVNINIKATPKIIMLKSFFDSDDILSFLQKLSASAWKSSSFLLKISFKFC